MPQAVDSLTVVIEQLAERLRDLESRIVLLESRNSQAAVKLSEGSTSSAEALPESKDPCRQNRTSVRADKQAQHSHPVWKALPGVESPSGIFGTLGKAALGFAGAFLFRALAESGSLPKLPVLVAAILYACFWMIWSARTRDRFASATFAITSVLILCPMLWEATVRFQSMPPSATAAVLVTFTALTVVVASSHQLQLIPWIAILAVVSTTLALIIGTRELVPLTTVLLAVAAITEVGVCLGRELTYRVVPALFADFGIWLVIYILGSGTVPEGHRAASPRTLIVLCAMLPAIYGASIGRRSFMQLHRMSILEIGQAAAALALSAFGILSSTRDSLAPILGIIFLLLCGVCYWGSLSRFAAEAHSRNRRVTATWAAALLLAGTFLLLPPGLQALFLCIAAVLTAAVYTRTAQTSLGLHSTFYIASAAVISSLAPYIWGALAGSAVEKLDWRALNVALAAALCYATESRYSVDSGRRRLLWVIPAGVAAFTVAAWTITAVIRVATGRIELGASRLSMIRTVVICVLALALGLASRTRHIELRWIAYAAVAVGTLKLIFEDLRFGNPASLVVSFVFYGLILIVLPRLTKRSDAEP
jgi:hypothetical protein